MEFTICESANIHSCNVIRYDKLTDRNKDNFVVTLIVIVNRTQQSIRLSKYLSFYVRNTL